jgi:ribonuclease D
MNIKIFKQDIPLTVLARLKTSRSVGWDIETDGLEWQTKKILLCQVASGTNVYLVRIENLAPKNLIHLLENQGVEKVFHHAPFDLKFMVGQWNARPANIACTKIASKILGGEFHSLKYLLSSHLGVEISKEQRLSDWSIDNMTSAQIEYAANDAVYLVRLLRVLRRQLRQRKLIHLSKACFDFLPTYVALEVRNFKDVFSY